MKLLQKLPGFTRSPAGLEWRILKTLPWALLAGTVIPLAAYLGALLWPVTLPGEPAEKTLTGIGIAAIAVAITAWTAVFTIAIGCCVVVLMKGPAYVADAYPLVDAERPNALASNLTGRPRPADRHDSYT